MGGEGVGVFHPPGRRSIASLHPARALFHVRIDEYAVAGRAEPGVTTLKPTDRLAPAQEHFVNIFFAKLELRVVIVLMEAIDFVNARTRAGGEGRVQPAPMARSGGGLCSGIGSAATYLADCPAPGSLRPARIAQSSRRLAGNAGRPETRKWRRKGLRRLNPRPEMAPRWRRRPTEAGEPRKPAAVGKPPHRPGLGVRGDAKIVPKQLKSLRRADKAAIIHLIADKAAPSAPTRRPTCGPALAPPAAFL